MEKPRLVNGETSQAILTASYVQPQARHEDYRERTYNEVYLKRLLCVLVSQQLMMLTVFLFSSENEVHLDNSVTIDAVLLLVEHRLLERHSQTCLEFKDQMLIAKQEYDETIKLGEKQTKETVMDDMPSVEKAVEAAVRQKLVNAYP